MIRHFPLDQDEYRMVMDARAGVKSLADVDESTYLSYLDQKREVLTTDYEYYYQCPSKYEEAAWETIELLLPNMAENYPAFFTLEQKNDCWTWTNRLLQSETEFKLFDSSTLIKEPLDWLASQVQEDLILMDAARDQTAYCCGGHLCFPSYWSLVEKMSRDILQIHSPVPGFVEQIGSQAARMMIGLKPGRSTIRFNWTITTTDRLNLASRFNQDIPRTRKGITSHNAGYRCYFRTERQTFSRLPKSEVVLFTIKTDVGAIEELAPNIERLERLLSVLLTLPDELKIYKGMGSYYADLIEYLRRQIVRHNNS